MLPLNVQSRVQVPSATDQSILEATLLPCEYLSSSRAGIAHQLSSVPHSELSSIICVAPAAPTITSKSDYAVAQIFSMQDSAAHQADME